MLRILACRPGRAPAGEGPRAPAESVPGGIHWVCYSGSLNAFSIRSRPHAGLEIRFAALSYLAMRSDDRDRKYYKRTL